MAKKGGWGARIYEARSAMLRKRGRKMTQGELGKAVGVTPTQIGFYESETNWPGYDAWLKMAQALQLAPGVLLFGNTHITIEEGVEKPMERSKSVARQRA